MNTCISVDPFHCRMWQLHSRLGDHITVDSCQAEIDSFAKHGQLVPVVGRVLKDDPEHEVELVCGARRLFVARYLKKPLEVEIRSLSDRDAVVVMDLENRQRKDLSPYEQGLSYAKWLCTGLFGSQEDLAEALAVSPSKVSRLLRIARLPDAIVAAFEASSDIREGWGLSLAGMLEHDANRARMLKTGRTLATTSPRPSPARIYQRLASAANPGSKSPPEGRDTVVKDLNGGALFRIRQLRDSISLILPMDKMAGETLDQISEAVSLILQNTSPTSGRRRKGPSVAFGNAAFVHKSHESA